MTLLEQITQDYKQAMIDKSETKKLVLNYVLAQAKNKKIELQKEVDDDEMIALIKKEIKAIMEGLTFLEKAGKSDEILIEQEKKQILESYLPEMLSREATEEIINVLISELGIIDLKTGRGLLMKELMAKYKSQIDGGVVNEIIMQKLSG